ncbi:Leucine-rich repeat-containing protein 74B [Durusdinium trenchii]|uniref:Leucine-rich repeat-containing protein 74B n=1 Tax=Durusdinium trenchii TaxID=1381693 RepID=A0ABP0RXL3_9DINO
MRGQEKPAPEVVRSSLVWREDDESDPRNAVADDKARVARHLRLRNAVSHVRVDIKAMAKLALKHGKHDVYKELLARHGREQQQQAQQGNEHCNNARTAACRIAASDSSTRKTPARKEASVRHPREADSKKTTRTVLRRDLFDLSDIRVHADGQLGPPIWEPFTNANKLEETGERLKRLRAAFLAEYEANAKQAAQEAAEGRAQPGAKESAQDESPTEKAKCNAELFAIYHKVLASTPQDTDSPRSLYMRRVGDGHLVPEPLGLGKGKESSELNLKHYGMGDRHAQVLADSIGAMKNLKTINLRQNRLSGDCVGRLLQNARHLRLCVIDLSENKVSKSSAAALASLAKESPSLAVLKLNHVDMQPKSLATLCKGLQKPSCVLKALHLSDTKLFDKTCGAALGEMLAVNRSITVLNLSWNQLSGSTAELFLAGLKANKSVSTLDLQWNRLADAVGALSLALSKNKGLTHLDLSYNQLDARCCKELSRGLHVNTTILGLHMAGNAYKVSPSGFLIPRKQSVLDSTSAHYCPLITTGTSICNAESSRQQVHRESQLRPKASRFSSVRTSRAQGSAVASKGKRGSVTAATSSEQSSPLAKARSRLQSFRSAVIAVSSIGRRPALADIVKARLEQQKAAKKNTEDNKGTSNKIECGEEQDKSQGEGEVEENVSRTDDGEDSSNRALSNPFKAISTASTCENCWICAKWRQVRIEFVDTVAAEEAVTQRIERELEIQEQRKRRSSNLAKAKVRKARPVKLPDPLDIAVHLSLDDFRRPRKLKPVEGDFKYEIHVMLPPGPCEFFFTVNGVERVLAPNQHATYASLRSRTRFQKAIRTAPGGKMSRMVPRAWRPEEERAKDPIERFANSPGQILRFHALSVLPRVEAGLPDDLQALPRTSNYRNLSKWVKEESMFADYPLETTEFVIRSFKADCTHAKFQRFVKSDEERHTMLLVLQENYQLLRVVYQLFCANSTGGAVNAVSWNAFTEFCQLCNIPDKNCKLQDLDTIFVATNVNDGEEEQGKDSNGKKLNPDRDLCRYEFVEIIARIAIQKFLGPKIEATPGDAVRKLIDEHLIPFLDIENPQVFRDRYLWSVPTDLILKGFHEILFKLFRRSADANMNRKRKRMTVDGFRRLLTTTGVFDAEACTERDARLAYRLAVINTVDEMTGEDHLTVGYTEFLELLGRTAFLCDLDALEHLRADTEEEFGVVVENATSACNEGPGSVMSLEDRDNLRSDNEDFISEEIDESEQPMSEFQRKLVLLLRILMFHPSVFDRTGQSASGKGGKAKGRSSPLVHRPTAMLLNINSERFLQEALKSDKMKF